MIEEPVSEKTIVNAVSSKLAKKNKPKSPCWLCGDLHVVKKCSYQDHFCGKFKRKDHKEESDLQREKNLYLEENSTN